MSWWEAVLLGLVQGLTEFLPVSSSGHLVLGQYVLGIESTSDVVFEVFVHFGTVLSIIAVYRKMIVDIIRETIRALLDPVRLVANFREMAGFRTAVLIGVTLIPTGVVYVMFGDLIESAFASPRLAAGMLLVTGLMLLATVLKKNTTGPIGPVRAFIIGIAQSLAMIPGISRSGSTICTALYLDVAPERAANFSFLMLLPVVLGATLLKTGDVMAAGAVDWVPLVAGTLVAFASGIVAIRVVLDFVRKGRLQYFAWYCFAVGTAGLVFIR